MTSFLHAFLNVWKPLIRLNCLEFFFSSLRKLKIHFLLIKHFYFSLFYQEFALFLEINCLLSYSLSFSLTFSLSLSLVLSHHTRAFTSIRFLLLSLVFIPNIESYSFFLSSITSSSSFSCPIQILSFSLLNLSPFFSLSFSLRLS